METGLTRCSGREKRIIFLLLIVSFGLALRVYKIGERNLWFDESRSLERSRAFKLAVLKNDYNPPLYYFILSYWIKCFGTSEPALRSLSTAFGLFSIFLIYGLGKLFFNARTGLLSAFILSISPIHIWYSQEARGYSLSIFLAMLTGYCFILALKRNKAYLWFAFILSSSLALYSNYFSIFIIILPGIFLFRKQYRFLLKNYLVSLALIMIIFLPFFSYFYFHLKNVSESFWIPKPNLISIAVTFANFNTGYNATLFIHRFVFIIFSILFILGTWRWRREKNNELLFLFLLLFLPIFIVYLISQRTSIYLDRQLLLFSPFYYIVLAAGLQKINTRFVRLIALLSIIIPISICLSNYYCYKMTLPLPYHIGTYVKKPVKPAADYLNAMYNEGDFFAYSDFSILNLFYYMPKITKKQRGFFFVEPDLKRFKTTYTLLIRSTNYRLSGMITMYNLSDEKSDIPMVKSLNQLGCKRIWLISSSWKRDGKYDSHVKAVREYMRGRFLLIDSKEFDGISVDLYSNSLLGDK